MKNPNESIHTALFQIRIFCKRQKLKQENNKIEDLKTTALRCEAYAQGYYDCNLALTTIKISPKEIEDIISEEFPKLAQWKQTKII